MTTEEEKAAGRAALGNHAFTEDAEAWVPVEQNLLCFEPGCTSPGVCPGGCATESPADMSTPALVREFARRDGVKTSAQHNRHCAVVDELRSRHVLD
ncbi:hypothetical protein OG474_09865 [Kribbella sp. NBC_01505]|uniref:hypothetical protein n=1 Tax=Kribbella sp. NBC_01505 TaxID=2903580 RepID=UPI0038637D55